MGGNASTAALSTGSWGSPGSGRGRGAAGRTPWPSQLWPVLALTLAARGHPARCCRGRAGTPPRSGRHTKLVCSLNRASEEGISSRLHLCWGSALATPAPLVRASRGPCSGKRAWD